MVKKILLIFLICIILLVLGVFAMGGDIDDVIRIPEKTIISVVSPIRKNVMEKKLIKERNQLIIKFGGQEKVNEMYKNSKTFCLNNYDCVIQDDWCCGQAINKQNYNPPDAWQAQQARCEMVCQNSKVVCQNNQCIIVYK